jgi:putative phosphoesterase
MRLGLIADVHANLHALDAVLAALDRAPVDLIVCAGDLVCYGAYPNEVLDRVRERGISSVIGNYDNAVAWDRPRASRTPSSPMTEPLKQAALDWTKREIALRHRAYLCGLPWSMEYQLDGLAIHLIHAGPAFLDEWLHPDQPGTLAALADQRPVDLIILGHTHHAFKHTHRTTTIVNPGAVGRSLDGDPRAAYAIVDTVTRAVTFERVAYDVHAAAYAIERSGMAPEIGALLRHGARRLEEVVHT